MEAKVYRSNSEKLQMAEGWTACGFFLPAREEWGGRRHLDEGGDKEVKENGDGS